MKAQLPEDSRTFTKLPSASPYGPEALSRPECDRRLKDLPGWRGL